MPEIRKLYTALNRLSKANLGSPNVTIEIANITKKCLARLASFDKRTLNTAIVNKEYFVFIKNGHISRPVNADLFLDFISDELLDDYISFRWDVIDPVVLPKLLYTLAMGYCAVANPGDKKTTSIFYEIYIGNIFAREYNVNPINKIEIDLAEIPTTLPTDYLFQPPHQFIKIHLPVKLSTRERSVQAWAHQRVLEGIYGSARFRGILVVMTETNYVGGTDSVVEVCLPDQWRIYQEYISKMTRVYYLDLPKVYEDLPLKYPHIQVKHFSEFFKEKLDLIKPSV